MKPLTARERRLVAVAIALALAALAWLGLVRPVLGGFVERTQQREQLAARFEQNERMIARIAMLRRAAEQQRRSAADFALPAASAEEGAELLRVRLGESLTAAGGELRSGEPIEAPAGWVRASAGGVMSYAQMVAWLERLGRERPYLVIETLVVGADRSINSNRLDQLDVNVEASIPLAATDPR